MEVRFNNLDSAIINYDKAIYLNKNNWKAHLGLAAIYSKKKKYELAKDNIENAFRLAPESPMVLNNYFIFLYNVTKNKELAKRIYLKLIKIKPNLRNLEDEILLGITQ